MKCSEELKEQAFHRVIRLVNLLMAAGAEGMSLAELAQKAGTSPEIARDDLITLSEYGRVPLFCSSDDVDDDFDSSRPDAPAAPPDQEVWTLASRDFAFPVTSLTHQESAMLLHILESLQECRTLAAMLRRSLKRPMERRRVAITGRTMYGEGQSEERIAQLEEYLAHRTCLHIVYQSARGQRVSRHICPVTLVYDWRTCAWYLYGYTPSLGMRHYRVSRMIHVSESSEAIQPPDDAEVEEHVRTCWGVEWSRDPVEVVVRFSDDFNVLTRMLSDTAGRPHAAYTSQPDGSVIYRDIMPGWNEFRTWVATFGESAEILKPEDLRRSMAQSVDLVLARYGE